MVTPENLAYVEAGLLMLFLVRGLSRARGTTLVAPAVWALVSTAALALEVALESLPGNSETGIGISALRFAVAASTLCPLMAVLGAKRPQNRGWQWVVLTLWVVLVGPAAQAVLIPTGLRIELSVVWKLFLTGQILVGLLNYLPTRHGSAACVFATGQATLLDNFLWQWSPIAPPWASAVGLGCFLAAAMIAYAVNQKKQKKTRSQSNPDLAELDQQWLDFRDALGALWALRLLARINQAAEINHWPIRLAWSGWVSTEAKPDQGAAVPRYSSEQCSSEKLSPEQLRELQTAMASLLRRFF